MFLRREHLVALVVALSLAASAQPSYAQWPVCTAAYDQYNPTIVSDGTGGAFVTWADHRSDNYHIYAQHVLASGAVDPAWTAANGNADGTPLCTAVGTQFYPTIVTDGAGGAIVAWEDSRGGTTNDIYAQHVLSTGAVDPAWPADGRGLCMAANNQADPIIVTDGAGGAIVAWNDQRLYPNTDAYQLYAQHVLASGAVDTVWTTSNGNADGTPLCMAFGLTGGFDYGLGAAGEYYPTIVTDGTGGAIVTWSVTGTGICVVQHVLASGVVDPVWTAANGNADGTPLCMVAGGSAATLVTDGAGGAIVTWQDLRSNISSDIYAQHVLASGAVDPVWTAANGSADGTPLCTATGYQDYPTIVTDDSGGAIVTWQDARNANGNPDIFAQHVLSTGAVDPAWPVNGLGLAFTTPAGFGPDGYPTIVTDGTGGAIMTVAEYRGIDTGIYAQHVLSTGGIDPAWPADGREVALGGQNPTIAADGLGGAITTWMVGPNGFIDIYAQRVSGSGGVSAVATGGPSFSFAVHAPHPNPASPQATISFDLASPQPVSVRVFDVAGRLVRTLAAGGKLGTGSHSLMWNGASDSGALAHAGIYFIRVNAGSAVQTCRVAIIR